MRRPRKVPAVPRFSFLVQTVRPPADYACSGGPHSTVHSPQWTSSEEAAAVYLHGAIIDHNILHLPPTTPVREGLTPQSTVHNGRHLWGLWQCFFITQQVTVFNSRLITLNIRLDTLGPNTGGSYQPLRNKHILELLVSASNKVCSLPPELNEFSNMSLFFVVTNFIFKGRTKCDSNVPYFCELDRSVRVNCHKRTSQ